MSYIDIKISEFGNRIFYSHKTKSGESKYFFIDKLTEGWSNETVIPNSSTFNINDNSLKFRPISSINDGKSLIVKTNQFQVGLVHENNGVWSDIEIAGDYENKVLVLHDPIRGDYFIHPDYPITHSDDGRVIIVQQAREISEDRGALSYDIYAYIKDQYGNWSKHLVNTPDIPARGWSQEVQLSGDGSKLFWIPEKPLAAIPGEKLK